MEKGTTLRSTYGKRYYLEINLWKKIPQQPLETGTSRPLKKGSSQSLDKGSSQPLEKGSSQP